MWLTRILCKRHTPGRIWGGKYRLVQKMTATRRRTEVKNERRVERNEELLATPYLTQAQEFEHAWERKQQEEKMFRDSLRAHKARKMADVYAFGPKPDKAKAENILEHLNVSRIQHE
ncbi:ribosomal protein 63, mitochondrial-like [Orbicella faveolata]|uniref:ribosomal protein 63, mitochondrial-like n=1 Tax=Orbicella faveolata TaxID=48498 RepID=UPI0009E39188|nr:ribosomal protein 63, mitochondrial-like [Orbicella faveolata]